MEQHHMKIVVIGGNGLIGSNVVHELRAQRHDVLPASRATGVDVMSGEGLTNALNGADVVVDVTNSPSFDPDDVLRFFTTSTRRLLTAGAEAGVRHHVALSVVGADRLPDSGYMRAKVAQESLIRGAGIPFTILRATQFFEFLGAIAASCDDGTTFRVPHALLQPVAANDVATVVADLAVARPANRVLDLGGPEALPMADFVRRHLEAAHVDRPVVATPDARYFGAVLDERSLIPAGEARIGATRFDAWRESRDVTTGC
jgi:uncharacterized protein YbjT (DUF2867 family)